MSRDLALNWGSGWDINCRGWSRRRGSVDDDGVLVVVVVVMMGSGLDNFGVAFLDDVACG